MPAAPPTLHEDIDAALRRGSIGDDQAVILSDWPCFLSSMGVDVRPHGGGAWFDTTPGSAHWQMRDVVADRKQKGVAIFAPRGTGKSETIVLPWVVYDIVLDPEVKWLVGSEVQKLAIDLKTMWIRNALLRLEEYGFGPFESRHWAKDAFTVRRPSGIGGHPTIVAWGPDTTGIGRHWGAGGKGGGLFDDLFGERSAENPDEQKTITRKFTRILGQRDPGARVIFAGTLWPGRNTYYYKILTDKDIKKYYLVLRFEDYNPKTGKPEFACLPKKHLEQQRAELGEALYRSQYKNRIVDDSEITFRLDHFHVANPPEMIHDPKLSKSMPCPLTTYVVCDPGWSQASGRKSSLSAIGVIQKTPMNHTYVMEVRMGKWTSTGLTRQLLNVFETWRAKGHPPSYYIMETQGPGGTMPGHVHDAARLLHIDPPVHVPVSHARKNKNVRITLVLAPMEAKRWFFSPGLAPEIFRMQQGEPHGLLGDAYMSFSMDSKLPLDGPDCLAIAMEKSAEGAPLCPPPDFLAPAKCQGLYQRSLEKMRGPGRRVRLN